MIDDELSDATERLHDEALRSIRAGNPAGYKRVLEAYESVLLAFPRAWARYDQRFDRDAASGQELLGFGPTEELFHSLGIELSEAVVSPSREVAIEAATVPARLARKAFDLDAIALSERALSLGLRVYVASERSEASADQKKVVKDRVWRGIYELAEYDLAPTVQDWNADQPQRDKAVEFLSQVFDEFSALLKQTLEARDTETLREADDAWSRILEFWEPEHEQPLEVVVEQLAEDRGEEDAAVQDTRRLLAIKQQMVSAKRSLYDLRSVYRYGLCMWALRRLSRSGSPKQWTPFFEHFAFNFVSTEEIVRVTTLALAAENEDSVPWSDWILFDLPEGQVHSVGADPEILRAFLTLMLRSADLEAQAPSLGPLEWLPYRLDQVEKLLDDMLEEDALKDTVLLSEDSLRLRSELLKESLKRSAKQQTRNKEEHVRQSPLDLKKVQAFQTQVRDAWSENRLVVPLFGLASSYEEVEEPFNANAPQLFGLDEWLPKALFVREPQVYGGDSIARRMGFAIARGEVKELLRKLSDFTEEIMQASNFNEGVRDAIRSMSEEGFKPSAVFLPVAREYRIDAELYDVADPDKSILDADRGLETASQFRGRIEGIPAFDSVDMPDNRICVLDTTSFAAWRQLTVDESGIRLLVSIEDFSEAKALELTSEYPNLMRSSDEDSAKIRAAKIRSNVYLKIRERYELKVKDSRACRWIVTDNEASIS